jgi:hypothetical protein
MVGTASVAASQQTTHFAEKESCQTFVRSINDSNGEKIVGLELFKKNVRATGVPIPKEARTLFCTPHSSSAPPDSITTYITQHIGIHNPFL